MLLSIFYDHFVSDISRTGGESIREPKGAISKTVGSFDKEIELLGTIAPPSHPRVLEYMRRRRDGPGHHPFPEWAFPPINKGCRLAGPPCFFGYNIRMCSSKL